MSFQDNIKEWVSLDNDIKNLSDKIKILRDKKKSLNSNILEYINTNNLNDAVININDGNLKFTNTKTTKSITLKYLEECLNELFTDKDKIINILQFIKNNREINEIQEIKRTFN